MHKTKGMKLFIKILLLLLLPAFVKAQHSNKHLDNLRRALNNAANDTIRMDVYDQLAYYFYEVSRDSSLLYSGKELLIARQLNLKMYEANALMQQGIMLFQTGNYPKSLESYLAAQKIAEDTDCEKMVWHFQDNRTPRQSRIGILAFLYYYRSFLYDNAGNTDKAISGCQKAINFAESIQDTGMIGQVHGALGMFYFYELGKPDSGLLFEKRSLVDLAISDKSYLDRKYNGWSQIGVTYFYMGGMYLQKGNYDSSLNSLLKAEQINREQNIVTALGGTYNSLGQLYLLKKNTDTALMYARKSIEILNGVAQLSTFAALYRFLSSIYSEQNKTDSAFAYLKLSTNLTDSLNNVERKNLLAFQDVGFDEQLRLKKLEEDSIQTQNKIRTYAMLAGIVVFMLIAFLLYRNNRNRKKANELLLHKNVEIEQQKKNVEQTLTELKSTQAQLIQSEKMASLGELTAGIAHEIQNPLNFVNNFSEVNKEMLEELKAERLKPNAERDEDLQNDLINDVIDNEEKINHHGKRADSIVKGMLQHSQSSTGVKEPTDINKLADEYLRLSYHGLRAKDKSFNATLKTEYDESIENINIIPQDIGRVVLNLINNAFYVVDEKKKQIGDGYEPTVSVNTRKMSNKILISVKDNGNGIPQKILDKIFQPFFTTKPTGQGTGLGLSLSYDVIKAHGGEIKVESKEGEGSEFIISLPVNI